MLFFSSTICFLLGGPPRSWRLGGKIISCPPIDLRSSAFICGLLFLSASAAFAHNPDTSYTRIEVEPHAINIRFILDLQTLSKLLPLDPNEVGHVAREAVMAQSLAIQKYLRSHIVISLDDAPSDFGDALPVDWPNEAQTVSPRDYQATLVAFPFRLRTYEPPDKITLIYRIFNELGDRHTNLTYITQPGASGGKEDEIIFTRSEPDFDYYLDAQPTTASAAAGLVQFLKLGVEHIFTGYDHILFLLALIVVSRLRDVVKIVTAFTFGHTVTLILAALQIVWLPTRLIEASIALTIIYVAVENLWVPTPLPLGKGRGEGLRTKRAPELGPVRNRLTRRPSRHRWLLALAFGLIHGFGFANVLRDLGLPTEGLVRSLVSFNVGVELGQIVIVLSMFPFLFLLRRTRHAPAVAVTVSILISLCGAAWFIDRVFALQLIPGA